jgi:hypothetical protein
VLTKSALVLRDLDLLAEAARRTEVSVSLSIGTLDEKVWRAKMGVTPSAKISPSASAVSEWPSRWAPSSTGAASSPETAPVSQRSSPQTRPRPPGSTAIALHLRPGVREHFMGWLRPQDRSPTTTSAATSGPTSRRGAGTRRLGRDRRTRRRPLRN